MGGGEDDDSATTASEGGQEEWIEMGAEGPRIGGTRRSDGGDRREGGRSGHDRRHHGRRTGEDGYESVAAFDVKTAKARADLRSQRGLSSGSPVANVEINAADIVMGQVRCSKEQSSDLRRCCI